MDDRGFLRRGLVLFCFVFWWLFWVHFSWKTVCAFSVHIFKSFISHKFFEFHLYLLFSVFLFRNANYVYVCLQLLSLSLHSLIFYFLIFFSFLPTVFFMVLSTTSLVPYTPFIFVLFSVVLLFCGVFPEPTAAFSIHNADDWTLELWAWLQLPVKT